MNLVVVFLINLDLQTVVILNLAINLWSALLQKL